MASFRPAIFDRHILALDVPRFIQALPEGDHPRSRFGFWQPGIDDPDYRHRRLLRARRERPRRRAAEKHDELAPPDHSITSSAATSSLSGTVRPNILAVPALMTNSNLFNCI